MPGASSANGFGGCAFVVSRLDPSHYAKPYDLIEIDGLEPK